MKITLAHITCLVLLLVGTRNASAQAPHYSTVDSLRLCQMVDSVYALDVSNAFENQQGVLISYYDQIIARSGRDSVNPCLAIVYLAKGKAVLADFGRRDLATSSFIKGLQIFTMNNDTLGIASSNLQLGVVSYDLENYETAIDYFQNILLLTSEEDRLYAVAEYLLALSFSELGDFEKANERFDGATIRYGGLNPINAYRVKIFKGKMLINQGKLEEAFAFLSAIEIPDKDPLFRSSELIALHAYLSKASFLLEDYQSAIYYGKMCSQAAENNGSAVIYLREANSVLHRSYLMLKNYDSAYYYLNALNEINDSLTNSQVAQRVAELRGQYEFDHQMMQVKIQGEIEQAKTNAEIQKGKLYNRIWFAAFVMAVLLVILIFRHRNRIRHERERSDKLLLNILPEPIAEELKASGKANARLYDSVSILFSDFKSFTAKSVNMSATQLVKEIDMYFKAFDAIMDKHGIEKIKTIGDAYMAAGGIPKASADSVKRTILAALEMQEFVKKIESQRRAEGESAFEMRAGIHTGPVVAGVVGVKKFQYDMWGDSVNTASRMESYGEVGKVNISQDSYLIVRDEPEFVFKDRGIIDVRGKGEMRMWYVRLRS